jgi:hypothetical protein
MEEVRKERFKRLKYDQRVSIGYERVKDSNLCARTPLLLPFYVNFLFFICPLSPFYVSFFIFLSSCSIWFFNYCSFFSLSFSLLFLSLFCVSYKFHL